MVMRG